MNSAFGKIVRINSNRKLLIGNFSSNRGRPVRPVSRVNNAVSNRLRHHVHESAVKTIEPARDAACSLQMSVCG